MTDSNTKYIRTGPHPLPLHVASATQNWTGAATAFPLFHLGGMQVHPDLQDAAAKLRHDTTGHDQKQLQIRIMKQAQARLSETIAGIKAYQENPYLRNVTPAPLFNKIGTTELRDYGATATGTSPSKDAPILLAIPSLVNPAYILDLMTGNSFMRSMATQNIHPYLLDWTTPGEQELTFTMEDYILLRIIPMIRNLHRHHRTKIHLLGYCMGGNLSLAAAQILQSENILKSLTLIATPWDFQASQPTHLPALTDYFLKMAPENHYNPAVPINIMQMFFFGLDPTLSDRKFRKFAKLSPLCPKTQNFVAIEDWANDGAPLSHGVTEDCLINWYQKNQTERNCWKIGGQTIDPRTLTLPGHIITPQTDRIVPPASAKALRNKLPHFTHSSIQGGHVSMIAGERAKETLWPKIASYLK